MNTGMTDAGNLAWKLALVAGGAPESLLDTYEQERVPVASSVLGLTDRLIGWATMRHPVKRALRDTLIPAATALPVVQELAARRLSQVSAAYPASPLIRPDGIRRRPRPGERVWDIEVRTGGGSTTLYRVLGGGRHVLVVSGAEIRAALNWSGLDLFAGLVDIAEGSLRSTHRPGNNTSAVFALVRPDGVLAARDPGGTSTQRSTTCGKSHRLTHHSRPAWHTSAESRALPMRFEPLAGHLWYARDTLGPAG